jgi:hypothetical protein
VKVEAADLSQLAIQDRMVVSVRVVSVALFIKFEEVEGETVLTLEASVGAAAEAHVERSGCRATAAALGPAMRALSTSTGLGFAHFGALAGVGKGQRASTAFKCFEKNRVWLIIKMNTASKLGFRTQTDRGAIPVWGSEFTTKAATLQGGVQQKSCPAFVYVGLDPVVVLFPAPAFDSQGT